jgi:hypothetical protein
VSRIAGPVEPDGSGQWGRGGRRPLFVEPVPTRGWDRLDFEQESSRRITGSGRIGGRLEQHVSQALVDVCLAPTVEAALDVVRGSRKIDQVVTAVAACVTFVAGGCSEAQHPGSHVRRKVPWPVVRTTVDRGVHG